MSAKHKRFLGISVLLILVGVFKMWSKGIIEKDEILWFNIFIPFGLGVLFMIYTIVMIVGEKR